jgi:hypothetical protein
MSAVELLLFDANRLRAESDSAYVKAGLDSERLQQCRKYREDMKVGARPRAWGVGCLVYS